MPRGELWARRPELWTRQGEVWERLGELWKRQGELWKRQPELWKRQGELWKRQGELWKRQGEVWKRQGELWKRQPELWKRQPELWKRQGELWKRQGEMWKSRIAFVPGRIALRRTRRWVQPRRSSSRPARNAVRQRRIQLPGQQSGSTCRELTVVAASVDGGGHLGERSTHDINNKLTRRKTVDRIGRSTLSSFQRVQVFLTQPQFAEESAALGAQLSELNDVIARLASEYVSQESSSRFVRAHVESQRKLRARLYTEHMMPISRVARDVLGATGMDRALLMPKHHTVTQRLLTAARSMAAAVANWKDVFLQHGLPADFIEQLNSAAAALEAARNARMESGHQRVTATASVDERLKRGRRAVRMLDAVLRPRLVKDPELLAAWESAKRVPPTPAPTPATDESSGTVAPSSTEKAA